jgi:hypothetical protein
VRQNTNKGLAFSLTALGRSGLFELVWEQRHKWQMPKMPKVPKMPKIKDVNHFIKKKSRFQNTSKLF